VPDLSLALAKTTDRCECFLYLDANPYNHFDKGWPIQTGFLCLPKIEK
jgi:hypothetical protein